MDNVSRREFLGKAALAAGGCAVFVLLGPGGTGSASTPAPEGGSPLGDYDWEAHRYAYLIDAQKCIGCGMCVKACKAENKVPDGNFRTWIERYEISEDGEAEVDSPNGGLNGFEENVSHIKIAKAFFVPKMCNHCKAAPCVQVCPVGATYRTEDGVVLVNPKTCIGCRYCIQACPYGARYLHPATRTADKCTFCYHRIGQGLLPACVEVCPTQARIFGDLNAAASPLSRFLRMNRIHVLKPALNTEPKVYYAGLDGEVR